MPVYFQADVISVLKSVLCFFMIILLLQGCQHAPTSSEPIHQKQDLSKAASINVQLGLSYLKQGDRPRAKKKLFLALDQEPKAPEVQAGLAYFFEQTHELVLARKYYLKAITLSSNAGAQLNNYGAFLCRQGEYKKAEMYFLNAAKDEHYLHTAGAYENAGICSLAIPDDNKAVHYFRKALEQDPSRSVSLYELVRLESKKEHYVAGFNLIQKHQNLVLHSKTFLKLAKDLAKRAGKYESAADYAARLKVIGRQIDNIGVNNEHNTSSG